MVGGATLERCCRVGRRGVVGLYGTVVTMELEVQGSQGQQPSPVVTREDRTAEKQANFIELAAKLVDLRGVAKFPHFA